MLLGVDIRLTEEVRALAIKGRVIKYGYRTEVLSITRNHVVVSLVYAIIQLPSFT